MPSRLDEVSIYLKRRKARLQGMRSDLEHKAAGLGARGWAREADRKAALAEAAALPLPPEDGGKADLSRATAAGTPFEEARGIVVELMRRGVVLEPDAHLAPLLRKASSPAELSGGLALLRTNHLLQAAVRLGAHQPRHSGLHEVLLQVGGGTWD
ncbi:hypothetical protein GPECTOR_7g942 [Gonium pectorale]|uniref:Uncharacterized protein n=1 Tax=Gonium pectorale TaxID=33097 RepID=A0A150GUV9_GONPE|nr:hypothetical protein GPECTOR_7g942 [Gonium pectorale]|eukprot:KXZ53492.1 hypothetical protein GPECTOR_7g942 [Gonium pectorale]